MTTKTHFRHQAPLPVCPFARLPVLSRLIALNIELVLFEGLAEGVATIISGNEVDVVRLRRPNHRLDRLDAYAADRTRRQPNFDVGVVCGRELEVLQRKLPLPEAELSDAAWARRDRVLHGWVRLQ